MLKTSTVLGLKCSLSDEVCSFRMKQQHIDFGYLLRMRITRHHLDVTAADKKKNSKLFINET